ncbi:MAG: 16S rRNA (uracil(1498)-N(3))-methyltransferase [Terricaulis sp.]
MAVPRIMVEEKLGAGAGFALTEAQARHVGSVLRVEVGDGLRVFNAVDGEWRTLVTAKNKRGMSVRIEEKLKEARAVPDLDLLFAPVKRHATDLIVEKATELGVRRIRPVITSRTIAETVRLDRLNAIAREAAEQTERFDAPEIFAPVSLPRALDGWDPSRALIYCDEAGDAPPILEAVRGLLGPPASSPATALATAPAAVCLHAPEAGEGAGGPYCDQVGRGGAALLIGPEGGFTTEERAMLRTCLFVTPVSLGPRILRAETAAIAALTIVQAAWGDWRDDGTA